MPMPDTNDGSTLIWLRPQNYQNWKNILLKDLDKYYHPKTTENVTTVVCTHNRKPTKGQVCDVDIREWDICSKENNFNYHRSAPCVFLKLNGLTDGWQPEYYNNTDDLPYDMPPELKHHIIHEITNPPKRNTVWVSCEGEYPVDVEFLGHIEYYPIQGFPGYYFPHKNLEGYLSPLLAVQFKRPRYGVVINIECRAWAKNIKYNRTDRSGSVHFELLLD
ncbi:hypothetical protein WA026_020303 [Henosepilachna vigintioctopunctata]